MEITKDSLFDLFIPSASTIADLLLPPAAADLLQLPPAVAARLLCCCRRPPLTCCSAAIDYIMGKLKTKNSFFKRKDVGENDIANKRKKALTSHTNDIIEPENQQHVTQEVENQQQNVTQEPENQQDPNVFEAPQGPQSNTNEVDLNNLERDPAKRIQMWNYPVDLREQVRRAYLSLGPFQLHLKEYPSDDTLKDAKGKEAKGKEAKGKDATVLRIVPVEERKLGIVLRSAHVRQVLDMYMSMGALGSKAGKDTVEAIMAGWKEKATTFMLKKK
ncbi:hypothetical protein QVD17_34806 [Tagetes erecta]|uniref:Uncharacterized protein n=1 Tax=Tagetes erecta TaxID=13708 RepID=A0AAD8NKM0_TARER|nr:hypothetical protein QVD17_34806 [Tagetes erecta]